MARQMSAESELEDMTECSICTEMFTDPRVLPCIHTFCLKCLLNYGKDSQPGDTMPCPLCRKEFTIPDDGLAGMQKNVFVEKLLHVRKLSTGKAIQRIPCDACSSDKANADESVKSAAVHCIQCQQNYCDQCSQVHAKMKATADHALLEIGKYLPREQIAMNLGLPTATATCKTHKGEEIKVFCMECKLAICMVCFIKSHKNHDCSGIEEVSDDFRKQVKSDTDKVTEELRKVGELLPRFEKEKIDLISRFAAVEGEVNATADKLIDAIQRDRMKLLSEVESIRLKRVKQRETVKEEVEQHMAALESFKRYSETLLSSGTACDVARSAKSLHDRADALTKFDILGRVESSLLPVSVTFTSSSVVNTETRNLIGAVTEDDVTTTPTVTHVMPASNRIGGVTSLCDDVFVARRNIQHVEVYDAVTFTLRRCLTVPGLGQRLFGLAVCAVNNCLYASDCVNNSVHRVELSGSNAVMKWSVARGPFGLTVNSAQNVLVVSDGERKLEEFTTRGNLARTIQLQSDIEQPRHVVQLSTDKFLVSHWGSLHRVCEVDVSGAVVRSYGGPPGSDLTNMNSPEGLAVDKHGNVYVADSGNKRLLVLDQSLSSAHEMSVSVDGGLRGPYSLFYDESRCRLYVGEWYGGRVIVIDNLKDFSTSSG